jgi:hypothetical protein
MDGMKLDGMVRSLTDTRRSLLGGALALAGGWLGIDTTDAKKRRKRKPRKKLKQRAAAPNAFGCIDVGELCQNAAQCCSGICAGKKGKRTCRAHDVGDCRAGAEPDICGVADIACTTDGGKSGACGTTTGNAGYCLRSGDCYACRTDWDCQRAGGGNLGPTAACIQCFGCTDHGGTACVSANVLGPMSQKEGHAAFVPLQV